MFRFLSSALITLLITAASNLAAASDYRADALAAVDRVQMQAPPDTLYEEYNSIIETFTNAEKLFEAHDFDEADKLFYLTLLKSTVYEQKLHVLEKLPHQGRQKNSAAPVPANAPGAPPVIDNIPHPSPDNNNTPPGPPPGSPDLLPGTGKRQTSINPVTPAAVEEHGDEAETSFAASRMIVGKKWVYIVKKGDSLRRIGARFGVNGRYIAKTNGLNPKNYLHPGQKLYINTRRILPKTIREGIVINIPDRTLYIFKDKKLDRALPVALGMSAKEPENWQTPTGKFTIVSKVKDPTWYVPSSIKKKMKKAGKTVETIVPPGESNPLGKYALKTSMAGILIHGTIAPESIYSFSSHGCIRVLPKTMEEIFDRIRINTQGEIVYQPVKIAMSDDKHVFLEVHADIYQKFKDLETVTKGLISRNRLEQLVDWEKVRSLLDSKSGIPEDITLTDPDQTVRQNHNHPKVNITAVQ